MDANERLPRIVQIEARFGPDDVQHGTGFRVGPGHVLTAQHVLERGHGSASVESAREVRVRLLTGVSGSAVVDAKVVWKGEEELEPEDPAALDAALLADELPADDLEPFRNWIERPLGKSASWEAEGFPAVSFDFDPQRPEYLGGSCQPANDSATYIQLKLDRAKPEPREDGTGGNWAGLSGGPVFVKDGPYSGHLYGLVRFSREEFPDMIYAVGTPALLRNAELRDLLDIQAPLPPHASLVENLREVLLRDSRLAEGLARLDPSWHARWKTGDVDALVDTLCVSGSLDKILEGLRSLAKSEDPRSGTAEHIREAALVLASILVPRQIPGAENLDIKAVRRIKIGTASPSFAEALLASAYGTPCLFESARGIDLPRAWLRVPAPIMESGIRGKSQIDDHLEDLLMDLLEKRMDDPRFVFPAQKALFNTLAPEARHKNLKKQLRLSLKRLEEREGRPAYLAADAEIKQRMGNRLSLFLDRLGKALPNLDLVILESGEEPISRAIDEEDQLVPLWEILDLLPDLRSA